MRKTGNVVVAVVASALMAAVAGFFIGRATKTAARPETNAAPSPWWHITASGDSWKPLPKAPIAGRVYEGVVWTGTKMIVWGGVARNGPVSDGAAYNPATRTWRTIAALPSDVRATAPGAVWTGHTAVFWAGNAPDGPPVGAVYDPRADSWRRLPAGPLGPREGYSTVWTGKEVLIIGGTSGDAFATPVAAAVDPRTGSWRVSAGLNRFPGLLVNGAVWDGHEVLVMGNLSLCPEQGSACTDRRPILVAYNPATDAVRELKLPTYSAEFGADTASSLTPIAWTGTDVVFSSAVPGSVRIFRYTLATGDWRKGRYAPCYVALQYTQSAWVGNRYVEACGEDGLQIYSPATDTWRTIIPGPSPLNSRETSAIVWTGTDLVAWSGSVDRRFNPNPTPDDGASLRLKN